MGASTTSTTGAASEAKGAPAVDTRLDRFFARDQVEISELVRHLDALPDAERARVTCRLSARHQAMLFDAALSFSPLSLDSFVPEDAGSQKQVIHAGKNSLLFFTTFEKRFYRPEPGSSVLYGYNENPKAITSLTGPGYFVCSQAPGGEVLIDYTRVPAVDVAKPEGWPAIRPNSVGGSKYIYNGTQDTMRGVSRHVSIGRAARAGKWMDNWFVLCRREG